MKQEEYFDALDDNKIVKFKISANPKKIQTLLGRGYRDHRKPITFKDEIMELPVDARKYDIQMDYLQTQIPLTRDNIINEFNVWEPEMVSENIWKGQIQCLRHALPLSSPERENCTQPIVTITIERTYETPRKLTDHPRVLYLACKALLVDEFGQDCEFRIDEQLGGLKLRPDVTVVKNTKAICVAEIGYTDAAKIKKYRELGLKIRWYDKEMNIVISE